MAGDLLIGLDVGTSAARAVLYAPDGRELGTASHAYPLETPRPGIAEQDPELVWAGIVEALVGLAPRIPVGQQVAAIGVSTIFHTLLAIGPDGRPLTRLITWADTRARRQAEQLRREVEPQELYQRTGCPVHPMYLPAKIRWLRQEDPERFARAAIFGSIKDEVLARLTGRRVVDRSVASASGLYNLHRADWDDEILRLAGIDRSQLPALVEPTEPVGGLVADLATRLGLKPGTPVVAGAGDGVLSSLGAGAIAPGQMTVMIGTSGATRLVTARPILDQRGRTWCYYLAQGRWVAGAAINNGGLACQWAQDNLFRGHGRAVDAADVTSLESLARAARPGSSGLLFLPFLTGERSPFWNANARGVLFGLAAHHGPVEVARAIFEGVCYRMRSIVEALDDVAGPTQTYRAAGGFTRSPFWLQLLTDVVGRSMLLPRVEQASAYGAAGIAAIGVGALSRLEQIAETVVVDPGPSADPELHRLYTRLYQLYGEVYQANLRAFEAIAAIQDEIG